MFATTQTVLINFAKWQTTTPVSTITPTPRIKTMNMSSPSLRDRTDDAEVSLPWTNMRQPTTRSRTTVLVAGFPAG
jgi:hypothetical protein